MSDGDNNFLSRWSRRKAQVREGVAPPAEAALAPPEAVAMVAAAAAPAAAAGTQAPPGEAAGRPGGSPPLPTLADVAALSPQSDYARFVADGVAPEVKNAALKKLFTDPHFNVMDGLDTYIDDYGKPDPLPPGMLRKMAQSHLLGLFDDEDKAVAAAAGAAPTATDVAVDAPGGSAIAPDPSGAPPGATADDAPH